MNDERPRVQCSACGKTVLIRKDGALRSHTGHEREFPGSPFTKHCTGSGKRQEDS